MKMSHHFGLLSCLLSAWALSSAVQATVISIDLTQVGTENPGGPNISGDTWRWDGGDPAFFDVWFSSGNGSDIDIDGGDHLGNEYHSGTEAASNHVYDVIRATFVGGGVWQIDAVRGVTTYNLGSVTEFVGNLGHAANYNFGSQQSDPIFGPAGAGVNGSPSPLYQSWFWIYRSTIDNTVSINISSGTAADPSTGDGGSLDAEIIFGGSYIGTPTILEANDGSGELNGTAPVFTGRWTWDPDKDDGGSIGGILTVAVPETSTVSLAGLALSLLAIRRRR